MTDTEYERLQQRVLKGKQWIEKIKQQGKYGTAETIPHIKVWMQLDDLLIREDFRRGAIPDTRSIHSKAWIIMQEREAREQVKRARRKPKDTTITRRSAT